MLTGDDSTVIRMIIAEELDKRLESASRSHLLREAVRVLGQDRHDWQARPCETCRVISNALGEPFGCVKLEKKRYE
jgi:hypothetical protein